MATSTKDPLGPNYRKLWVASTISNLGDGVRLTALPLMAARITRDPAKIAAIDFASTLPWFLFALFSGALVDRMDRRHAMGIANIVRAVLVGALAIAVATGNETLVVLYVVAFLLGSAETVFDNAAQAILPAVVRKDQLERANGRMYAAEFITNQFVGPPLGAFLFVAAAASPFFLDSASFLIAALLILSFTGSFTTLPATRLFHQRRCGRTSPRACGGCGTTSFYARSRSCSGRGTRCSTATFSIFVVFALEILDVGEVGYGILFSSFVIGSVAGSLMGSAVARRVGPGTCLMLAVVIGAATMLVVGLTSNPFVVGAMFAIEGFVTIVWNVITVSMRQTIIPDRLLGRVNSVYRLFGWGSMPIGAALGGFLALSSG